MNGELKNKWLTVTPVSGTADGEITISGAEHTGRAVRLFSLVVRTVADDGIGGAEPEEPISTTISGRMEGIPMFLSLTAGTPDSEGNDDDLTDNKIVVSKSAHTVTLSGKSNASTITVAATPDQTEEGEGLKVTFGDLTVTPSMVDVEGNTGSALTIASGAAITGDPGLYGEYDFEVVFDIPANVNAFAHSATVTVTAAGAAVEAIEGEIEAVAAAEDIVKTFTIEQLAGEAYLYLNSEGTTTATITIPAAGTAQTVQVLSNVSWEVVNGTTEA